MIDKTAKETHSDAPAHSEARTPQDGEASLLTPQVYEALVMKLPESEETKTPVLPVLKSLKIRARPR
jgi:hypothetical protein